MPLDPILFPFLALSSLSFPFPTPLSGIKVQNGLTSQTLCPLQEPFHGFGLGWECLRCSSAWEKHPGLGLSLGKPTGIPGVDPVGEAGARHFSIQLLGLGFPCQIPDPTGAVIQSSARSHWDWGTPSPWNPWILEIWGWGHFPLTLGTIPISGAASWLL